MCKLICRLCLSEANLLPLFKNSEQIAEYSSILYQTTGLKIESNDGYPQEICETCSNAVDLASELRKRSQNTEKQLQKLGYPKTKINKIIEINETEQQNEENIEDCDKNESFTQIESDSSEANGGDTKWPMEKSKKISKKEQRQLYLGMVDGEFDANGPVRCKICKTTVSKWSCFLSHAKLHLGFNFVCEFCGKSFISTTKLTRHCRSHHGMKRELKCRHCSYLALDKGQLKLHERRAHSGERPFVCDVCASSYHSRRCLVQHIETHRTIANVQCENCPQMFKSQRALSRHRYSAHTNSRVACPHCARVYSRKYLNAHIGKHHSNHNGD